jgi:predicted TIM-barrel fold metal-dependent hydrolase
LLEGDRAIFDKVARQGLLCFHEQSSVLIVVDHVGQRPSLDVGVDPRLDRGYEAFRRCREHLRKLPSEYLRDFYYDTVNFDPTCLQLTLDFARIGQVLAGSDYPHMIGSLAKMKTSISELQVSEVERAALLGGNEQRLLKL